MADFYASSRIQPKYRGAQFADFHAEPDSAAKHIAQQYALKWPPEAPFLTLTSPNKGNGKTLLAVCIQEAVYRRHRINSRFWRVTDLLDRYRATFGDAREKDEQFAKIDQEMRRVPLLVLDDLGAEKDTDWTRERLFSLIDYRYAELMPTVITTNVDPRQLDERVASRLTDKHTGRIVVLAGPDRRARDV